MEAILITALFSIALFTLLFSMGLTRAMMYLRIADVPNERSSHTVATPKGGGVAIIFSLLFFIGLVNLLLFRVLSPDVEMLLLLSGAMGIMGVLDDVFQLSYKPRLAAQLTIGIIMVANGFVFDHIPLPGVDEIDLGPFGPMITILWVVGFINAFNFMDGLNGLAAGGALVVSFLILLFMPTYNPLWFVFYGLIFALLGYLRYNFPYGRVFMSDVGSQFLGTLFAVATLVIEPATNGEFRFYIIPLLFLPFIYDTSLTFIMRVIKRKDPFQAHREFLFHRLVDMGWSHAQVTLLYAGLILLQGAFVHYFLAEPSFQKLGLNLLLYICFSMLVYKRTLALRSAHA